MLRTPSLVMLLVGSHSSRTLMQSPPPTKKKAKKNDSASTSCKDPSCCFFVWWKVHGHHQQKVDLIDVSSFKFHWRGPHVAKCFKIRGDPTITSTDALFLLKETQGIFRRSLVLGHVTGPTDLITPQKKTAAVFHTCRFCLGIMTSKNVINVDGSELLQPVEIDSLSH